jgi:putative inorganic carbon (HCO3(-)) transporter
VGLGIYHYLPLVFYLASWVFVFISLGGRPLWGLYYLMPLLPYRSLRDHFLAYPLGGNMLTILIIAIVVGALIHGKRLPKSSMNMIWLISILYLYLSMWVGTILGNGPAPLWFTDANFILWKDYTLIPLIFVAANLVIEDRKAVKVVVIITAITLLVIDRSALTESLSRNFSHFDESKRDAGPLGWAGANGLAAFLAQFALFFWGFGQFIKKRAKLLCYGLVAVTIVATLYTFSRGAYIAVLVGVFLLGVLKDRKLLLAVLAFMFTWQAILPVAVTERVTMTESSNGNLEASAASRIQLWDEAKTSMLHNPLFGTGYGTYQYGNHVDGLKDTHNWYVKVMVETGIIGMALVLALLQQMLAAAYRAFKHTEDPLYRGLGLGLFLAVSGCIISNIFGDRWNYPEIIGLLWVLTAAAVRVVGFAQPLEEGAVVVSAGAAVTNPYMAYR